MKSYPYMVRATMQTHTIDTNWTHRFYDYDQLWFSTRKSGTWQHILVATQELNTYPGAGGISALRNYFYAPVVANNGSTFCILCAPYTTYYPGTPSAIQVWLSFNEGATWSLASGVTGLATVYGSDSFICANGIFASFHGRGWYISSDCIKWEDVPMLLGALGDNYWVDNSKSQVFVDSFGTVHILVQDYSDALWHSTSSDFRTWTEPVIVEPSGLYYADGITICGFDKKLAICFMTWGGTNSIYVYRSTDNGKTFTGPTVFDSLTTFPNSEGITYWLTGDYSNCPMLLDGNGAHIYTSIGHVEYGDEYNYWEMVGLHTEDLWAETPAWTISAHYPLQAWLTQEHICDPIAKKSWSIWSDYTYVYFWEEGAYDGSTRAWWCVSDTPENRELIDKVNPGYGNSPDTYFWNSWISNAVGTENYSDNYTYSRYSDDVKCYREFSRGGFAYFF